MNKDQTLVDFHLHTSCSDGAWAPDRVFEEIRGRELEYFCISDHDNMDAYPVAPDLQSRCVAGIEIDTEYVSQTVHVLCYGMTRPNGTLMDRLEQQRKNRQERGQQIIDRLNALGIDLTLEQVSALSGVRGSIGRPHIARALVSTRQCETLQQAFDEYLAEGCRAYVALDRFSTAEAVDLIHEAGAVAVLAHPRRLRNPKLLDEIVKLFDGVEVVHPTAVPDDEVQLYSLADSNGMITTGGTDFHARSTDGPIGIAFSRDRVARFLDRLSR